MQRLIVSLHRFENHNQITVLSSNTRSKKNSKYYPGLTTLFDFMAEIVGKDIPVKVPTAQATKISNLVDAKA